MIGEKLFGKVYKEPDYWLYVMHSFQDPAAVKYLMPLLQYRCGPVGKIILALTEKHGDMQIVREYLEDEKSEPRVRAELLIMLSYAERSDLALPAGLPSIHGLAGLVSALRDEQANVKQLCHHVLLKQSKLKMPPDFVLWKDWLLRREAVPDVLKLTALSMWNYKPVDIPMEVPIGGRASRKFHTRQALPGSGFACGRDRSRGGTFS